MKRFIIGIMALVLTMSLAGCDEKKGKESSIQDVSSGTSASDEKLVESHKNYEMGIGYFNKGDYENAKYKLELVIKDDPDYEDAQKKLEEMVEIKRQKFLSDAESEAKSSNYTKANEILNKALEEYPDDKQIKDRIDEYENSYHDSLVSAAAKSYDNKDYIDAIKNYNMVLLHYPNDKDAQSKLEELKTIIESDAEKQMKNKQYTDAVEKMKTLVDLFPKDDDIGRQYKTIYESSVQGIISQADAVYKKDGYFKAIQYLKGINGISDSRINDKITYYYGFEPVYLKDLEAYSGNPQHDEELKDRLEKNYTHSMYCSTYYKGKLEKGDTKDNYVTYYVKSQYKTFEGVLSVPYEYRNESGKVKIEIYADDSKIYTSDVMSCKSAPKAIKLDISNVDFIKIVWLYVDSGYSYSESVSAPIATLFDARLTKN